MAYYILRHKTAVDDEPPYAPLWWSKYGWSSIAPPMLWSIKDIGDPGPDGVWEQRPCELQWSDEEWERYGRHRTHDGRRCYLALDTCCGGATVLLTSP